MSEHQQKNKSGQKWIGRGFDVVRLIDVLGGLGGTLTGLAVLNVLVGDGELSEVAANHVELDFDWEVVLSVVDTDYTADH